MVSNENEVQVLKNLGYAEICELLPHRPPFLLVDRVEELRIGESIEAYKNVSALEPYFPGHFPTEPIVPGVLMVEGLAQCSAVLMFKTFGVRGVKVLPKCVLTGIQEVRFRRVVVPGDQLRYSVKYVRMRGNFVWFEGKATVENEVAAEASFSAMFFREGDGK